MLLHALSRVHSTNRSVARQINVAWPACRSLSLSGTCCSWWLTRKVAWLSVISIIVTTLVLINTAVLVLLHALSSVQSTNRSVARPINVAWPACRSLSLSGDFLFLVTDPKIEMRNYNWNLFTLKSSPISFFLIIWNFQDHDFYCSSLCQYW